MRSEVSIQETWQAGKDLWSVTRRTCPMATFFFLLALVVAGGRMIYAGIHEMGTMAAFGIGSHWFLIWMGALLTGGFIRSRWPAIRKQAIELARQRAHQRF